MSFYSNYGRPRVEPLPDQCEMIDSGPDDEFDSQCLEPAVGFVPERSNVRVCAECAKRMEGEKWTVIYWTNEELPCSPT